MGMKWIESRVQSMDADALASMYAEVVRGVPKGKSLFAGKSAEAGRLWDQIVAEVAARPGVEWDVPNEVPRAV